MQWLQKIVRPEIWNMTGYSSARMEITDVSGMIQLDANENPYLPYLTNKANINGLNRYPHPQPDAILSRLAAVYKVKPKQLLVGRGMDEIMDVLVRVFCIPYKDKIIITPPTYGYYEVIAEIAGIKVDKVPFKIGHGFNFILDVENIIKTADRHTKIIFLCTPNNPTGNILALDDIGQIAKSLPNTIIAVDEAYLEFANAPSATTIMDKYPNMVVMKTLSKAYAFAGVRVGTLIAVPEIINVARKVLAPYPIPQPIVSLVLEALSPFGLEFAHSQIELLKSERERVYWHLRDLPVIHVYPSQANFLLFEVENASQTYKDLLAKGVILRNRDKDVENTIRFTIGSPAENDLVLRALGVRLEVPKHNDRQAVVSRKTNETEILAKINLDKSKPIKISTGIGFFDHMLEQLARHGGFSLELKARGDTHIDYHHTVEDAAIVIGQVLKQALGDKRGINRYGFVLPMDEACAFATLDLSGRGVLVYEAEFKTPLIGDFPVELVEHFFLSMSDQLEAAIHLKVTGNNAHHMVEGLFKAFARALNQAITRTNDNNVPSTKGLL